MNKGWTKNIINSLLAKFGTVDRRSGSGRRSTAHADKNVDTVESLLLSLEDKPQSHRTVKRNFTWGGGSVDHQFRRLYTKICVSSATRKGALNSCWLKRNSMHALFSVCSLRDDDVISNKKTYMKTETCILYSGVFWIFLLIIIKIDRYNFELYHFKVGPFFMRHSVDVPTK